MAALALLHCPFLQSQSTGKGDTLGRSWHSLAQTPLLGTEVTCLQDTDPGAGRKGSAEVLGLGRRHPHPLATAFALVTNIVFSVTVRIARALTHTGVSPERAVPWLRDSVATPHRSMNIATEPSSLPSLGLDAVIDSTQTGSRVRFDISEPSQQGACEGVDRLISDRCFIPVTNGWPLPLRLPGLAPANFLRVGHIGATHFETFFEVRVLVIC